MTEVGVIDIDGKIIAFCKTSDFKKYVKNVVDDEMFWKNLGQKHQIKYIVDDHLNDKLKPKIESEVNSIVPKMVRDQLNNYTIVEIPNVVAKSLSDQIGGFLNNNIQMQQILAEHMNSLNRELEHSANGILNHLVGDDKYHEITKRHLEAATKKYETYIFRIEKEAAKRLEKNKNEFQSQITLMHEKVNNEIDVVKQANDKIKELEKKIGKLNEKLNDKASTGWLIIASVGVLIAAIGIGGISSLHYKL